VRCNDLEKSKERVAVNDELRARLSNSYFKLLSGIDWNDELLVAGIREGLNKFLSNAMLSAGKRNKHLMADFVSQAAQEKIDSGDRRNLVFEHMVPKQRYIQEPCVSRAKVGTLSKEFIDELLQKYWHIAIITRAESVRLHPTRMPTDWDEVSVHARYVAAQIDLASTS
jgi:hypothetical protein